MAAEPGVAAAPAPAPLSKLSNISCPPLFLRETSICHLWVSVKAFESGCLIVELGDSLKVSEPQFPHLQNWDGEGPYLRVTGRL